jgi:uncharacterized repeat protein (TIGR01451 family)
MATFTNQALLTYNNTRTLSNVTTGTLSESLTAGKSSLQSEYGAGDRITYVLSLQNSGAGAYTGLTVTDDLGAFTPTGGTQPVYPLTYDEGSVALYVDGVKQTAPEVSSVQPLTLTGINVPAGENAIIIYSAQANGTAPLASGSSIVNTATVTGTGLTEPVEASNTLPVSESPLLTIEKTLSPLTVTPNQTITYTFVISNYGNAEADATANVSVSDTIAPPLTGLTATYNGVLWTEGTQYTYSAQTGEFVSSEGVITVPAATYETQPDGTVTTTPGTATLVIEGTVA